MKIPQYAAIRAAEYILSLVKKITVPVQTGELRKAIFRKTKGNDQIVGTNKIYARMVHEGSDGPVEIRPKKKKGLFWPGARHPMKKVTLYKDKKRKADPFLTNAGKMFKEEAPKKAAQIWPEIPKEAKKEILKKIQSTKNLKILKK